MGMQQGQGIGQSSDPLGAYNSGTAPGSGMSRQNTGPGSGMSRQNAGQGGDRSSPQGTSSAYGPAGMMSGSSPQGSRGPPNAPLPPPTGTSRGPSSPWNSERDGGCQWYCEDESVFATSIAHHMLNV